MRNRFCLVALCVFMSGATTPTTQPTTQPATQPEPTTQPTTTPTTEPTALETVRLAPVAPDLPAKPTMQSLRLMLEAGQYNDVLRLTTQLLNQRRLDAELDRTELMSLKALANLRLRKFKPAQDGYQELAKLPATTPQQIKNRCVWQSTAWLINASSPRGYVVRLGDKRQLVELVTDEGLQRAMKAFYADQSVQLNERFEAATKSGQLGPILELMDDVSDLAMLEVAVTDQDTNAKALRDRIQVEAVVIIDGFILRATRTVQSIEDRANQLIEQVRERHEGDKTIRERYFVRRGLDSRGKQDLRAIQSDCEEVARLIRQHDAPEFTRLKLPIQSLYDDASRVLKANYFGEVRPGR